MDHKKIDTVGGFIMIIAMLAAIILSNVTIYYNNIINQQFYFFNEIISLKGFTKDVLMIFFFVYIGMELRLEFYDGCLVDRKHCIFPLMAAFGGMLLPSIIYMTVNINYPQNYIGFAIPCATDIAFAVCLFNLIGKRLPTYIRIFLLSIAIFDDLGAIVIIATCYSKQFNIIWFLLSIPVFAGLWLCNRIKITLDIVYICLGILLSITFYRSGLHTTLAGFIIGFSLPINKKSGTPYLKKIMHKIHPLVQFIALPVFAFTSSGIVLSYNCLLSLFDPIVIGIVMGLFFGKQIGITLFSFIAIYYKWINLPSNVSLKHIYFVSIFAGIGFTMSLFIGQLAFKIEYLQNLVKIGVIISLIGCVILAILLKCLYKYTHYKHNT